MNPPPAFDDVDSMETTNGVVNNGGTNVYTTISPSVRRIRTLKRRKEHEKENSNKNQVGKYLYFLMWSSINDVTHIMILFKILSNLPRLYECNLSQNPKTTHS